ncbi:MAG: hypothetical protein Q9N67_02395 [Ghiorsea sp.]|nr:hypothetical protein [Ghiorsea sp.]
MMNPDDRRRFNIHLTEKGKGLLEQALPMALGFQMELVEDVSSEDKETTVEVLKQLTQTLMNLK